MQVSINCPRKCGGRLEYEVQIISEISEDFPVITGCKQHCICKLSEYEEEKLQDAAIEKFQDSEKEQMTYGNYGNY